MNCTYLLECCSRLLSAGQPLGGAAGGLAVWGLCMRAWDALGIMALVRSVRRRMVCLYA